MGSAGGIVLLLIALYLLLAFFSGRLEWLFRLDELAAEAGALPARPTTTGAR